jgi:hypothetical protein
MSNLPDTNFLNEHPMLIQEYAIYTPPIDEFFNSICEWIDNKVPGGYIYGVSRLGKSRAIKFWLRNLIEEKYDGRIIFFSMNYKDHQRPSEREFMTEILTAIGHKFQEGPKTFDRLQRVIKHMCVCAKNSQTNHVILMIDEAQFMHDHEYKWLCNIQNEMDRLGFRFTVISVGSHELTYQHEIFAMAESAYLMSRFMVRNACFHGIRSQLELEYVLNGYDIESEWPKGSGLSFTHYFFPRAYLAGFRIVESSVGMWEIFGELAPSTLNKNLNVPMEHIAKTVEYLFRKHANSDSLKVAFSKAILYEAIKQTGYEQHMHAISLIMGKKARSA